MGQLEVCSDSSLDEMVADTEMEDKEEQSEEDEEEMEEFTRTVKSDETKSLLPEMTVVKENKEGGWSWLVVVAGFLCVMVLGGIVFSFGVFLEPLHKEMRGGRSFLSIAGSMQVFIYGLVSPSVATLVSKFGARTPCMVGAVISALGLIAASFTQNIPTLTLCYSVVTGIGFGMMYIPSVVIVSRHFVVRRSLAMGIVLCASGSGTFVVAPLAETWMEMAGWRVSMRGLAVLCLCCVLCGAVMFPRPAWEVAQNKEDMEKGTVKAANEDETRSLEDTEVKPGCLTWLLGYSLVSSPLFSVFMLLLLSDCLFAFALYIPYTYLPGTALANVEGVDATYGSLLISIIGVSSMFGGVLAGWMSDQTWSHPLYLTTIVVCGTAPLLFVFFLLSNYYLFYVFSVTFGLFSGVWTSATPPLLVHILGLELMPKGFGMLTFGRGFAALCGPPLAGIVVDMLHSPGSAFIVAGAAMTGSSLSYLTTLVVYWRTRYRMEYEAI